MTFKRSNKQYFKIDNTEPVLAAPVMTRGEWDALVADVEAIKTAVATVLEIAMVAGDPGEDPEEPEGLQIHEGFARYRKQKERGNA